RRQLQAGDEGRHLARVAVLLELFTEPAVRRDSSGDTNALRAESPGSLERAIDERGDDDSLERRADVGDLFLAERRTCADVAEHRRLQSAEAEVEIAFQLRRISIGVCQARGR